MCPGARQRKLHFGKKKKNSIGNSPSTVQEAYDAKTVCVEQNNHC